jgi:hypothetical protein
VKIELFKIICIESCQSVVYNILTGSNSDTYIKKGQIFDTNTNDFNWTSTDDIVYSRVVLDGEIAFFEQSKFKKLQEYREIIINEILNDN